MDTPSASASAAADLLQRIPESVLISEVFPRYVKDNLAQDVNAACTVSKAFRAGLQASFRALTLNLTPNLKEDPKEDQNPNIQALGNMRTLQRLKLIGSRTKIAPFVFEWVDLKEGSIPRSLATSLTSLHVEGLHLEGHNLNSLGHLVKLVDLSVVQLAESKRLDLNLDWMASRRKTMVDMRALTRLTALESLDLRGSHVSDLAPIAHLTSLTSLKLDRSIEDLRALSSLPNLRALQTSNCVHLADLSPLAHLTTLRTLDVSWCSRVTSMAPLARLTSLTSLDLTRCGIEDLEALSWMSGLRILHIEGQINDLSPLTRLRTLEHLYVNQISDLAPLAHMTTLKSLDMSLYHVCTITSLAALSPLRSLTQLVVRQGSYGSLIEDISPLSNLIALKLLKLHYLRRVRDLSALSALSALERLCIAVPDAGGVDLSPLSCMASLTKLDLYGEQMTLEALEALSSMKALHTLTLRCTLLEGLEPLAALEKLENLHIIGGWKLSTTTDLSQLAGLSSLRVLALTMMVIKPPIASLATSLKTLKTLRLHQCSMADSDRQALLRLYGSAVFNNDLQWASMWAI